MHPTTRSFTIGLDLGDRCHTACVLNEAGDIVTTEAIVNTRERLAALSARFPAVTLILETGHAQPVGVALVRGARPPSAIERSDNGDAANATLAGMPA